MMMRSRAVFCAVSLALFAAPAFAADMTIDELVSNYQDARGGADAWKAVQTARMTGNMSMGPMEAPFQLEFKRDQRVRMEFQMQGMTAIQAYDGEKGWAVMPFIGKTDPEPMSESELKDIKDMADFDGALIDSERKGHKVTLTGLEEVEGTEAWRVEVVKADGDQQTWWLDSEYFLPIKTAGKTERMGQMVEVSTTIGDYKEVNGLMFPFSLANSIQMGNQPMVQTITIDEIETGVELTDEYFQMPAVEAAAAASEG